MIKCRIAIINCILKNEGPGWNHREGSYRGIMPETYAAFQQATGEKLPHQELPSHRETVIEFYEWYLEDYHTWELPEFLQYIHGDFATNAGAAATRIIQRIVGATVDGVWGPQTRAAVARFFSENTVETQGVGFDNELIDRYDAEKRQHYRRLARKNPEKYKHYLSGWLNRCDRVRKQLAAYYEDEISAAGKAYDDEDTDS